MAIPWLRILDAVIGVSDLAVGRRSSRSLTSESDRLATSGGGGALGHFEARLAGVVVAALKEAFDRDSRRLDLEREQMEMERERAARALKLELLRQAGEREIGRWRLLAALATVSWLATLFLSVRLAGGPVTARALLAAGWALLLVSVAWSFAAQSRVAAVLARAISEVPQEDEILSGVAGSVVPVLIVLGLALVGAAMLIA